MSHQGEDGWYPECKGCGCGNIGSNVYCEECFKKQSSKFITKLKSLLKDVDASKGDKITIRAYNFGVMDAIEIVEDEEEKK